MLGTRPNILISSAAAKVSLVQSFQAALNGVGKVFSADITADCATAQLSDGHFVIGRTDQPDTAGELLTLCREQGVGLIVPTRDGELPFFAALRDRFRTDGVFVHVAEPDVIALVQDKRAFTHFLNKRGLAAMPVISEPLSDGLFPIFVRPVSGAGGRGAQMIASHREYDLLGNSENYLVHPFIDAPEYTIDLLMDLDGRQALDAVCRERLQIVAGESKISRVVDRPDLSALVKQIGEALGLVGHNTVQAFLDPVRGPVIIEVNARFGGASNLSIQAGLDSPGRILALLRGDVSARAPRQLAVGTMMFRYSQDVIVTTPT